MASGNSDNRIRFLREIAMMVQHRDEELVQAGLVAGAEDVSGMGAALRSLANQLRQPSVTSSQPQRNKALSTCFEFAPSRSNVKPPNMKRCESFIRPNTPRSRRVRAMAAKRRL